MQIESIKMHGPHPHKPSLLAHLAFLGLGLVLIVGLYLYFRNMQPVVVGGALLVVVVLVHVAIAMGIIYVAYRTLKRFFMKIHGVSPAPSTEGITLRWALFYDLLLTVIFFGKERKFRESIVNLAQVQPGEKVLDVGCGTGSLAIAAAAKGGKIHGIDAAPEMIERARRKANKAGMNIDFHTGLVEAIDFPDDTFDVVLSSLMVHHLPDSIKSKAFSEMHRVLRPGGRLFIVDFEPPRSGIVSLFFKVLLHHHQMMRIDNSQIPPLLGEVGFTSLKMGNTGYSLAAFIAGMKTG